MTWREEKIFFLSKTHPKATSKDLLEILDPEIPVCSGLIRKRLVKANLGARIAVKKPLMNAINRKKPLDWCQKNQCFDKEYWQNWIFRTQALPNCIQRGENLSEDLEMHHYAQNTPPKP